MTEKTILQWYQELPAETKNKAIDNFNQSPLSHHRNYKYPSLKEALKCGFVWQDTKEGFKFWESVFINL